MNVNSENTNNSEPAQTKHRHFWLKFSITITLLLVIVWLIFYLFSNILFHTAIKTAFSNLSNQQYSLTFDNLKINLLTRKITFYNTHIKPVKKETDVSQPMIDYYSDTLTIQKIDFISLKRKQTLKIENILLSHLKLIVEEEVDDKNKQKLLLPLNNYLDKLQIQNLKLFKAEIKYKKNNDSIYLPNLNLSLSEIKIDSLRDTVKSNRFHFSDLYLALENQKLNLPNNSHTISWGNLELSTKEKYLRLENLKIKPLKSDEKDIKYSADINSFSLSDFEFDSLIQKNKFLTGNLFLDINGFDIHLKTASDKSKTTDFKQQLNTFFKKNFKRIIIEKAGIKIANGQLGLSDKRQLKFRGITTLDANNFQFNPENSENFSLDKGNVLLNDIILINDKNKEQSQFKQGQLNFDNRSLKIQGIDFVSDSTREKSLHLEEIQLTNIDWTQLINRNELLAKNLYLSSGNFIQKHARISGGAFLDFKKIESTIFPLIRLIRINNIQFDDWNYSLASKAINAKNISIQLNQFQLPRDPRLAFGAFSNFEGKIKQFSWVSNDQRHHYLANEIITNSLTQSINISKIQSFPRWKTLNNEMLEDKARFKIFGEHINMKTQKPFNKIRLNQSIEFSHLSIDSLNLKQFGKKVSEEKLRSNIPPVFISSFELLKGDFSAFNDSSIVSRLAQVNKIHLQGDSLEIYSDSLFRLNYKRLFAVTENGYYQNKSQGLSFNFEKINFDSEDETMGMLQVKAEISSKKHDKSVQHNLDSKLIQIKGFDHNLFLQRNLISAQELKISSPKINSNSYSKTKQKRAEFRNLFSEENLRQLPYLKFDKFIIRDLTWLATYTVLDNSNVISIAKANFEAIDFRLNYRSFANPDRLLFSKSIDFSIEKFRQHFRNRNYLLMVDDIIFSSLNKKMDFIKIQFYTLQKANRNNYNFTIDQISFNEINFADFQQDYSLSVENILIQKPITKLRIYALEENSVVNNLNSLELYSSIEPYFSQIALNRVNILDMNLKLEIPKGNSTNTYNLGNLNLQMNDFRLDESAKAFQNNRFFYSKNTLVHLRDYSAQISNDLYRVNFTDLRLSTLSGIINIDSVSLKPLYNYTDFASRVGYQTDRFDIEINSVKLSGIDFQDAIFRQKYKVQKAELNRFKGEAFRDGLFPRLPDYFPPNPIQRLLDLPYFIQVDSLLLNDAFIAYKERGIHTQEPGHIYFNNLNAQILNATNNPDFIKYGGNTILTAQAYLMGKGKLDFNVIFPLLNQGKSFQIEARLNTIEMDALEPILRPLALIQARSGTIESVELLVEANDDFAYGEMLMLYDNMKVVVLNKSMKKGFLGTLFANAMIRTENTNTLFPRKGPIYFERNKMRSIFNYWAEISILGMKTSMGLAERRTAKKVKKLKKSRL